MGSKVTFDPTTRIIQVDQAPVDGVVNLDVKVDLYSDGKEDWVSEANLITYPYPIRSVGGDPLPGEENSLLAPADGDSVLTIGSTTSIGSSD